MYADYEYYTGTFRAGASPPVPADQYTFLEAQAEDRIRYATQGRSDSFTGDELSRCTCELVEFLYEAGKAAEGAISAGGAGVLSSYSNDGLSASFHVQDSAFTETGKEKRVSSIIRKHLLWTGLLYRGVGFA